MTRVFRSVTTTRDIRFGSGREETTEPITFIDDLMLGYVAFLMGHSAYEPKVWRAFLTTRASNQVTMMESSEKSPTPSALATP